MLEKSSYPHITEPEQRCERLNPVLPGMFHVPIKIDAPLAGTSPVLI